MIAMFYHARMMRAFTTRRLSSKVYASIEKATEDVKSGSTLLFGGFGLCGIPENAIKALAKMNLRFVLLHFTELVLKLTRDFPMHRNLTCVSNDFGTSDFGLGLLLKDDPIPVKRVVASYVAENTSVFDLYREGKLEVELVPQVRQHSTTFKRTNRRMY